MRSAWTGFGEEGMMRDALAAGNEVEPRHGRPDRYGRDPRDRLDSGSDLCGVFS